MQAVQETKLCTPLNTRDANFILVKVDDATKALYAGNWVLDREQN